MSERAWLRRVPRPATWYLDLGLLGGAVSGSASGGRTYHHTAPVAMVASLHAALGRVLEEGLAAVFQRHQVAGEVLQDGLVDMGLELFAAKGHELPQLTTVVVPDGVESAAVRARLLTDYGIEIGAGAGEYASTVWRIGLMGHNARLGRVEFVLAALRRVLGRATASTVPAGPFDAPSTNSGPPFCISTNNRTESRWRSRSTTFRGIDPSSPVSLRFGCEAGMLSASGAFLRL